MTFEYLRLLKQMAAWILLETLETVRLQCSVFTLPPAATVFGPLPVSWSASAWIHSSCFDHAVNANTEGRHLVSFCWPAILCLPLCWLLSLLASSNHHFSLYTLNTTLMLLQRSISLNCSIFTRVSSPDPVHAPPIIGWFLYKKPICFISASTSLHVWV